MIVNLELQVYPQQQTVPEAASWCVCQVRKVIWRLFAIWPNAEAAAGASDDTLVIVEKLIQPLGLFRKRTMAIKRFSQEYLTAQVKLHLSRMIAPPTSMVTKV